MPSTARRLHLVGILAVLAAPAAHAAVGTPARIHFQTSNHLILLETHVRSDSGVFILDTGASSTVVDQKWAGTLGLRADSTTSASATGGTLDVGMLPATRLRIGPIEWTEPAPVAVRLDGLSASLGTPVRGIIGSEFFRRFVVQLDYSARTMTLLDSTAVVKLAGDVLPIDLVGGTPFVTATLELPGGRAASLRTLIDTGATGALGLNTPTVDRLRLTEPASAILPITSGPLLASSPKSAMRRIPAIRIGSQRLAGVIAALARETEGDRADSTNDGYLGGELLQRFTVWVDYPHQRVVLIPGRQVRSPFEFDMSGLSLVASGLDFSEKRVRAVLNGSPAQAAGFRAGDVLLSIDHLPAGASSLDRIRALFRMPRRTLRIAILRNGERRVFALRTRRLI